MPATPLGSCALRLNGDQRPPSATLEQAFATVTGVTYDPSFDIAKFDLDRARFPSRVRACS